MSTQKYIYTTFRRASPLLRLLAYSDSPHALPRPTSPSAPSPSPCPRTLSVPVVHQSHSELWSSRTPTHPHSNALAQRRSGGDRFCSKRGGTTAQGLHLRPTRKSSDRPAHRVPRRAPRQSPGSSTSARQPSDGRAGQREGDGNYSRCRDEQQNGLEMSARGRWRCSRSLGGLRRLVDAGAVAEVWSRQIGEMGPIAFDIGAPRRRRVFRMAGMATEHAAGLDSFRSR
ncbi:hypothetical protein VTO73DRAFT_3908 [Trametes versicolor]